MDVMTDHYGVRPNSRHGSSAWWGGTAREHGICGSGLAHQYQHGLADIPVDCPPVDWWLFLFPEGIEWCSLDEQKVHALICHVARDRYYARHGCHMLVRGRSPSVSASRGRRLGTGLQAGASRGGLASEPDCGGVC